MKLAAAVDMETGLIVSVEIEPDIQVVGGFPWWWRALIQVTVTAMTILPKIASRWDPPRMSLEELLHELGHARDQAAFVAKYGAILGKLLWFTRYFWRWAWTWFSYAKICDEATCKLLAKHQRDWWAANGQPAVFTLAMQRSVV